MNFKGKRVYPPDIWNEADRKFWFERNLVTRYLPPKKRAKAYENFPYYPDGNCILVLPTDHPVRKYIKTGRPIMTKADGETILE